MQKRTPLPKENLDESFTKHVQPILLLNSSFEFAAIWIATDGFIAKVLWKGNWYIQMYTSRSVEN